MASGEKIRVGAPVVMSSADAAPHAGLNNSTAAPPAAVTPTAGACAGRGGLANSFGRRETENGPVSGSAPGSEPDLPSDGELAAAAARGSEEAFCLLLRRHRPLIWAIAWRLAGNTEDAWDISQEVVIRLWRALPHFRAEGNFAAWARTIAAREALRWLERNRPGRVGFSLEDVAETSAEPPDEGAVTGRAALEAREDRARDRERIGAAMTTLAPRQRLAVTLRYFEEMPVAAIADAMECSVGSVKQHLFRGLEKLRRVLRRMR